MTASGPTSITVTLPTEPRAVVPPCPEGERRLYGTCAPETRCFVADDCGPDERCFGNTCLAKSASADERCTADTDCLRTERCVAERCAALPDDAFGAAVRALRDNVAAFNTADVDAFLQFYPEVLSCFWGTSNAPVREERHDPNLPGLRPLEVTWRLRLARNQTCLRIRTVTPFVGSTPTDTRVALTVSYVDRTPYYPDGGFEEKHYLLVRDNPTAPFRVEIETAEKHGDTGNTFPCFTKIQEAVAAP